MATAPTYTKTGTKAAKQATLPKVVFGAESPSHSLIAQAYETHMSNKRNVTAKTKTRAMVRGGGRKPWRQKGLGRARVGSIRSPIWTGGGVTFGPTGDQNYHKKLNKTAARKALTQALTLKSSSKSVHVIEDLAPKDGKTKELVGLLNKLKLEGRVMLVADKTPELVRASANIKNVDLVSPMYINVKSTLDADALLITKDALEKLETRLGGKK